MFVINAKGWFPLRIIFLRTGTDSKVFFVLSALGRNGSMALTQRKLSCPFLSWRKFS